MNEVETKDVEPKSPLFPSSNEPKANPAKAPSGPIVMNPRIPPIHFPAPIILLIFSFWMQK